MRVLAALCLLAACAHAPPASAAPRWDYEVTYDEGTLHITARFPPGTSSTLVINEGFGKYVLTGVLPSDDRFMYPDCERGCTVRYDFDLMNSSGTERGGFARIFRSARQVIPSTPDQWLVRPVDCPKGTTYRLKMILPPTMGFVSGISRTSTGTYEASAADLVDGPYSAFGDFTTRAIGNVTLAYPKKSIAPSLLEPWAERAVKGVAAYFGAFPVPNATIIVLPSADEDVGFGSARGGGGAAVQIMVGHWSGKAAFEKDWVLIHELIHLGFPNLPRDQSWMEEGLSTYAEPVIRARLGIRTPQQLWTEFIENLPGGLADGALNSSGSWASTYWGGAAFWFLADVMIRDRTGGKKTIADVLRAIVADGGNINESWSPQLVIQFADRATGVPVFAELWATLAERHRPKLTVEEALLKLGVRKGKPLDDTAPWAAMRKSISAPF